MTAPNMEVSRIHKILSRGDKGDDVKKLQTYLYVLGYLPKSGIDGIFGGMTENAIKDVQRQYNKNNAKSVPIDGQVGLLTWHILDMVVAATPKRGSIDALVASASNYLVWAGLLSTMKSTLDVEMETAIVKFQTSHGLYATGTLNTRTVAKLVATMINQIKTVEKTIVVKEILNGEVNAVTKSFFMSTGLGLLGIAGLIWYLSQKKRG